MPPRLTKATVSGLLCAIGLVAFAFAQSGVEYFRELISGAGLFILAASMIAFLFRLAIPKGGYVASALYGLAVAIVAYIAVIAYATSRI